MALYIKPSIFFNRNWTIWLSDFHCYVLLVIKYTCKNIMVQLIINHSTFTGANKCLSIILDTYILLIYNWMTANRHRQAKQALRTSLQDKNELDLQILLILLFTPLWQLILPLTFINQCLLCSCFCIFPLDFWFLTFFCYKHMSFNRTFFAASDIPQPLVLRQKLSFLTQCRIS